MVGMPNQAQAEEEQERIWLVINNHLYTPTEAESAPMMVEDRVYVPLRLISSALGYEVQWLADSKQVIIGEKPAALPNPAGETIQIIVHGTALEMNQETGQPFITDSGFTMIPLRTVGTALACDVHWEQGVVIVSSQAEKTAVPVTATITTNEPARSGTWDGNSENLSVFGDAIATQAQMEAYLADKEKILRQNAALTGTEFVPYPENIAGLYLELGQKYHIRGDIAFAQALKETGYFQFKGSVQPEQNNYCGLGATGIGLTGKEPLNGVNPQWAQYIAGSHGITFATPALGVEAHLQHLYAYASQDTLPAGCQLVDPRFRYVQRGVSPRWIDLDGHWAIPGEGYGESILNDFWQPILDY